MGGETQHKHKPIDLGRYESFKHELVQFLPSPKLSEREEDLVRNIVVLDHRSLHAFGPYSRRRSEVKALLQNSVIAAGFQLYYGDELSGHGSRNTRSAIGLYQQAREIFDRYLQSVNRLWYLGGVFLGVMLLVITAFSLRGLPGALVSSVEPGLLATLIFFAGLGSSVSVLLRLGRLDLGREILRTILVISGVGRPFVASAFALVVYLLIHNKLIGITLTTETDGTYFVIAFLCGFSERFAQDLLARVKLGAANGDDPSATKQPRKKNGKE